MSIKIYSDTKVYVVAPANTATGGPELLHQLVYHLRKELSIDAYMYYLPNNHPNPVHEAYRKYNNPFVRNVDDNFNNLIIVPEVYGMISILGKYKNIRKVVWWLSVDNFFLSKIFSSRKNLFIYRSLNKLFYFSFNKQLFDMQELAYKKYLSLDNMVNYVEKEPFVQEADYHLVQSFYAKDFLKKANIRKPIYFLSDYLNENFLKIKTNISEKKDIVAYNPKKGFFFTKKIIKAAPNIKFIPIINMARDEVIKTLQIAKVYIDFGNHPGKDRLPREAAILNCCVITGKKGAAKYYEDVPIPNEYKFDDKVENIPKIINKIRDCFSNFEKRYKDFDSYRDIIKQEPKKFVSDLEQIFTKINI